MLSKYEFGLCLSDFMTFILNLNTFKKDISLMSLKIDLFITDVTVSAITS